MQWRDEIEFDRDDNISNVSGTEDVVYEDTDSDDETEILFSPNTISDKDCVFKNETNWLKTLIVTGRVCSENIISNKMGPTQKSNNIANITDALYLLIDDKIV